MTQPPPAAGYPRLADQHLYLAGFRGAALRVREAGQAVFSYVNTVSAEERERFTAFW